jgi:hypothetical protein
MSTKFDIEATLIELINIRGDQEGLFKLVTLDRILNRITRVTSGCWWLVVVNAIPTGCLIKNASTHNFFIYYAISMNKKTKDMVFHALRSSHKKKFWRYFQ